MGRSAFSFPPSSGGSERYTNNNPSTVTVGGIEAGSTFVSQSMTEMFNRMLYPYADPTFATFTLQGVSTNIEVGDQIDAAQTFQWTTNNSGNVQAGSVYINDVTGGNILLASGLSANGSQPVTLASPISHTAVASQVFRIFGQDTQAGSFQRDATFNWRWRAFYGTHVNATLTESDIESLTSLFPVTSLAGSYVVGAPGYKYLCFPDAIGGQINSVKDPLNFDMPMATPTEGYTNLDGGGFGYQLVSVTNSFGVTGNYRVYRTYNTMGSGTTLTVT